MFGSHRDNPYGPGFYTEHEPYDPGPVADRPARVTRRIDLPQGRVSVRMEQGQWEALEEIAARHDLFLDEICAAVARDRKRRRLAEDLQAFTLRYFRSALHRAAITGAPPPPPLGPDPVEWS